MRKYISERNTKIVTAIQLDKEEEAKKQFNEIQPFMKSIIELGTLRPIKYLLEKKNIKAGICREPLLELSVEEKRMIDKVFSAVST
nr:dihydrodipicolinate synthase family protein [Priestia megaterium]